MESKLVTVIVLNWNRKTLLKRCIDSLKAQTYRPLEIILVDNGSHDGSPDYIREHFPEVRLLVNEKNLGFCGGNNVGLREAKGDYIALMNNDAVMEPECIAEMVRSIEKGKDIGAVATKILLEDKPTHLDAAGIGICLDGLSIGRGRMEEASQYNEEAEVFFVSDCVSLYRKEMIADIGLYDDDFFAYAEETDMGWRARLKGWRTLYNPKAVATHSHSSTLGSYSPFKVFLVERNRVWVAIKNLPLVYLVKGLGYTFSRYFYQAYSVFAGKGAAGEFVKTMPKWQLAWILVKAMASAALGIPKMLMKRREILGSRRITNKDIDVLFEKYGFSAKEIAFKC